MEYLICFAIALALIVMLPVAMAILGALVLIIAAGVLLYAVIGLIYIGSIHALNGLEALGVWLTSKAMLYGEQISIFIGGLHKRYFTD